MTIPQTLKLRTEEQFSLPVHFQSRLQPLISGESIRFEGDPN